MITSGEPNNHSMVTRAGAKNTSLDGNDGVYDGVFHEYFPSLHAYSEELDAFLDFESLRLKEIPNHHTPMASDLHPDFFHGLSSSVSGVQSHSAQRSANRGFPGRSNLVIVSPRRIAQQGTTTLTNSFLGSTSHAQNIEFCSLRSYGARCSCRGFRTNSYYLNLLKSNVLLLATNYNGCRFLLEILQDGTCEQIRVIFGEVLLHIVQLMVNPIANYLVQAVLGFCNEEQMTQIILAITTEPGKLIGIALNTYGSRVVQKLIETVKSKPQITLLNAALEPGFLDLIDDQNGNRIILRCLQFFDYADNKFILHYAAKFSLELATLQYGCLVLQPCIRASSGDHREILVDRLSKHGLFLAQNQYGNYVVQCLIELRIPHVSSKLVASFQGKFMQLAMQKFGSHVVEKCLDKIEESRAIIVKELLEFPNFERLLMDPFANYVIQRILEYAKGCTFSALKAKIQHHGSLRSNPYCKKIFYLLQKQKRRCGLVERSSDVNKVW